MSFWPSNGDVRFKRAKRFPSIRKLILLGISDELWHIAMPLGGSRPLHQQRKLKRCRLLRRFLGKKPELQFDF
jgi:hypothetical protein